MQLKTLFEGETPNILVREQEEEGVSLGVGKGEVFYFVLKFWYEESILRGIYRV